MWNCGKSTSSVLHPERWTSRHEGEPLVVIRSHTTRA
jgi:hypothetical protein